MIGALLRQLLRLLDELLPALGDDLLQHVGIVWDALGVLGPVAAIAGLTMTIVGAVHLQDWQLRRRLPGMRRMAEDDVLTEPVLEVVPRLRGFRRLVKPKRRLHSVRLDEDGVELARESSTSSLAWDDVTGWSRSAVADWTLMSGDRRFSLELQGKQGFNAEVRRRFDHRVAYYVSDKPMTSAWESIERELPRVLRRIIGRLKGARTPPGPDVPDEALSGGPSRESEAAPPLPR